MRRNTEIIGIHIFLNNVFSNARIANLIETRSEERYTTYSLTDGTRGSTIHEYREWMDERWMRRWGTGNRVTHAGCKKKIKKEGSRLNFIATITITVNDKYLISAVRFYNDGEINDRISVARRRFSIPPPSISGEKFKIRRFARRIYDFLSFSVSSFRDGYLLFSSLAPVIGLVHDKIISIFAK